jgi:cell division septation protein DedD
VQRIPVTDGAADDNPISRVIIPGGPGFDQPQSAQQAIADVAGAADQVAAGADQVAAGDAIEPIGPKKVRTVVVKPDGTIISSQQSDAGANAAGETAAAFAELPRGTTEPAAVAKVPAVTPPPTNNDVVAIAGPNGGVASNGELTINPLPEGVEEEDVALPADDAAQTAAIAPAQPAPAASATVVAKPAPAAAAPATAQQTQTAALSTSGGMLVQVSSQRSEEAARATFRDLQLRYPRILGPYPVNVQKADLGDRGVFYRARVGPFSAADAQRLCDDLKAEGGDCVLSRN